MKEKPSKKVSKFRGVCWAAYCKKWRVRVFGVHVGYFTSEKEAAEAYIHHRAEARHAQGKPP